MDVIFARCCGLDVHKESVVACVRTAKSKTIKTFKTTTRDLLALSEWLISQDVEAIAMESTGSFWKPIYNILEGCEFRELMVVNSQHIKKVPGRKTDASDAEWIADLLRHGLLKGSLIPKREERELRELIRYRKSLIGERASEVNRVQKVLEGANIKLSSVVTNVVGVSGRAMLESLIEGTEDPKVLAALAKRKMKGKIPLLEEALEGLVGVHQKRMLRRQLAHIDFLDQNIEEINREVEERQRPFESRIELLETIPGVGRRTAQVVMATFGNQINRFPTHKHLASWCGLCPGNNESGGKRMSGRTRKGCPLLKTTMVDAAWGAVRKKDSYHRALFQNQKAKGGAKQAIVAVAHSMLTVMYHMLKNGTVFQDLGPTHFTKRKEKQIQARALRQLENLGYTVTISRQDQQAA